MRIGTYEPNQVAVQESKGGHLDVRVPQENLGTGIAQGVADIASAVQKGTAEADRLRRTSAVNDHLDLLEKLKEEGLAKMGQDAADPARNGGKSLAEVMAEKFDAESAKLLAKSPMSRDARAAFNEDYRGMRRQLAVVMSGHAHDQLNVWKSGVYSDNFDKMAGAVQGLASMPPSPARDALHETYTASMVALATEEAKRTGKDPDAAARAARSTSNVLLVNTLLAGGKDIAAKATFDKAVADGALTAQDTEKLKPVVESQSSAGEGQRAAVEAFDKVQSGSMSEVDAVKGMTSKLDPKAAEHAVQWFNQLRSQEHTRKQRVVGDLADKVFNMRLGGASTASIAGSNHFARLKVEDGTTAFRILDQLRNDDRIAQARLEGREPGFADLMREVDTQVAFNKIVTEEPILTWSDDKLKTEAAKLGKKWGSQLIKVWGTAKANPGKWSASMQDITNTLKTMEAYTKKGKLTEDGARLAVRIREALDDRDSATGKVVHPSQEDVVSFTQRMAQQHTLRKGVNMTTDSLSVVEAPRLLDDDRSIVVGSGREPKFLEKLWAAIPQQDKSRLWNQITSNPSWQSLSKEAKAATNNMVLRAWVREYEAGKVKLQED